MKRMTLLLVLWAFLVAPAARAGFYDEACQQILLKGRVELPPEFPKEEPLLLTLSYQMNYQQAPSFLTIKLPKGAGDFEISIVGYRKKEAKDYEIPQMFWYPRAVTFRYHVQSQDGRWKSASRQSVWHPAATKIEEVVDCDPALYLELLQLKSKSLSSGEGE